jgi:hypothetical protein
MPPPKATRAAATGVATCAIVIEGWDRARTIFSDRQPRRGLPLASKPVFAAVVCPGGGFAPGITWFDATPPGGGAGAGSAGAAFAVGSVLGHGHSPGPVGFSGAPLRPQPASPKAMAPRTNAATQSRKRLCAKNCSPTLPRGPDHSRSHRRGDILAAIPCRVVRALKTAIKRCF